MTGVHWITKQAMLLVPLYTVGMRTAHRTVALLYAMPATDLFHYTRDGSSIERHVVFIGLVPVMTGLWDLDFDSMVDLGLLRFIRG